MENKTEAEKHSENYYYNWTQSSAARFFSCKKTSPVKIRLMELIKVANHP